MPKRIKKCPGCGEDVALHAPGTAGRECEGLPQSGGIEQPEQDPTLQKLKQRKEELLRAIEVKTMTQEIIRLEKELAADGPTKTSVTTRRTCFCVLSTCKNVSKRRASVRAVRKLRTSYASQSFCVSFVNAGIRTAHAQPDSVRSVVLSMPKTTLRTLLRSTGDARAPYVPYERRTCEYGLLALNGLGTANPQATPTDVQNNKKTTCSEAAAQTEPGATAKEVEVINLGPHDIILQQLQLKEKNNLHDVVLTKYGGTGLLGGAKKKSDAKILSPESFVYNLESEEVRRSGGREIPLGFHGLVTTPGSAGMGTTRSPGTSAVICNRLARYKWSTIRSFHAAAAQHALRKPGT
ncbi:hypothetical protein Bbelb_364050 [Branchiostoma belcheri]|nr:hypothetical protein Bbelb_364050 [Branchiostoma belcheri]